MIRSRALALCLVLTSGISHAQDRDRPLALARIQGAIMLDGFSDEAAWQAVTPFPMIQHEPVFGGPPSEATEIRVAYDDAYLYVALRAYDSDPSGIRGNILYRDRFGSDDYLEVQLDTYNDNQNAVIFTTSPSGIRRDTEISNDASGPYPSWINVDFNTFWDVESVVTDEGWFAEMRIPFSSLRFQDENGRVVMGLILHRIIARKSERSTFPAIEPNAQNAFLKASRAQKVVLEGVYSRRPLQITPYALSGASRDAALNEAQTAYRPDLRRKGEIGVDLKYGLTNELTLDLTANTDFAQVEADDQQFNLTRFSLFFPEKRQFFQERSSTFEFDLGSDSRLFHSRRIGLTDEGRPVRLLGGARLVGRVGAWDLGLLNMQTAENPALPGENFGVVRLKRQMFNPHSFGGGMFTSRVGLDGRYNVAYGLDGLVRLRGDDYLAVQWAQTFQDAGTGLAVADPLQSGQLSVEFERRRRKGFGYDTEAAWSGPHFDPGIGFVQRRDFTMLDQTFSYSWLPGEASGLIWHTASIEGFAYLRNADRAVETLEIGPEWSFARKSGAGGDVEAKVIYDNLIQPFSLPGGVGVPAGAYTFYRAGAGYSMSRNSLLATDVNVNGGTFYDGWQATLGLSPSWYASPHLELGGTYILNLIRFPERGQRFLGHIARLRVGTALNTQLSANTFVQYNSATASLSANARFRYNLREGNDLWIVYNEGLNTDRYAVIPVLPFSNSRTIMLKYTHTFQMN